MKQMVIESPILNSPFEESKRHFSFSSNSLTNDIIEERRISSCFVPVPNPRKKSRQMSFETEWTKDRIDEGEFTNQVRSCVSIGRHHGCPDGTHASRTLLQYRQRPDHGKRLFFRQTEAIEMAIYIAEATQKSGDAWIIEGSRGASESANPGLFRIAFTMAIGNGRTVVIAILVDWHTLNRIVSPQDARLKDASLAVAQTKRAFILAATKGNTCICLSQQRGRA